MALRVLVATVATVAAAMLVGWSRRRRARLVAKEDWTYIDRNIMVGQVGVAACLVIAAVRVVVGGF